MDKSMKRLSDPWHPITLQELAQHKDIDKKDAWMAIKGIVYNVSAYAAVHPGGAAKIQKYAGMDATDTFNMIHSYVDIETLLDGYQVGVLKDHAPKRTFRQKFKCLACLGPSYKHPTTYFKQDSIVGTYTIEFNHPSHDHESDWSVGIMNKRILQVYKCVDKRKAWFSTYELPEEVFNDQIILDFQQTFAHAEITVRKPLPTTVWAKQSHGLKESGEFVSLMESHCHFGAFIVFKKCVTSNMLLFGIQIVKSGRIGVPIGLHVNIYIGNIHRPYTPVCFSILESNDIQGNPPEDGSTMLFFMIKIYPNGKLTSALDAIEVDEGNEVPTMQISFPFGTFDRDFIHDFALLMLVAGGSGITPMLKMIKNFWRMKNHMHGRRVVLIVFSEKDHDIVWRKQFEQVHDMTSWFHYFPVLTKPSAMSKWEGLKGRINPELVKDCLSKVSLERKGMKKACICGPPGFNAAAVDSLSGVILSEHMYVFAN